MLSKSHAAHQFAGHFNLSFFKRFFANLNTHLLTVPVAMAAALLLGCLTVTAQIRVAASESTRVEARKALKALDQPSAEARLAALVRLAEVGTMADADRVALRLHDDIAQVRQVASAALWQIWSRSGNKAIDNQYQRGVQLMEAAQLKEAVSVFSDIIKKQPTFAEAWNKRATLYFMLGEYQLSLSDCDEVLKRNRHHFGALSGYAQRSEERRGGKEC